MNKVLKVFLIITILAFLILYIIICCVPFRKIFPNLYIQNYIPFKSERFGNSSYGVTKYMLYYLTEASEQFNFKYFISEGALIGIARNDELLCYDHDIEIYFVSKRDEDIFLNEALPFLKTKDLFFKSNIGFGNKGDMTGFRTTGLVYKDYAFPLMETMGYLNIENDNIILTDRAANALLSHSNSNILKYIKKEDMRFTISTDIIFPIREHYLFDGTIKVYVPNKYIEFVKTKYGKSCIDNIKPDLLTVKNHKLKPNRFAHISHIFNKSWSVSKYKKYYKDTIKLCY